ncbi:MAG: DNA-binding protein [Deltaproteobacteria bacterium]|nr:DNA-binding protein [Deltaproteobacteria bacterium]
MKRDAMIGVAVLAVLAATVSLVAAEPGRGWKGSGGWGMGGGYQRMYNTATVETVSGTIESIDRTVPMKGMNRGVHLTLKAEKGPVAVHLGPEWYVERQDIELKKGDSVEVKGSRVTFAGNPAIIAAEVKKGDNVLKLRDDNGVPAWAGWRR